jgi:type IV pilus assembly protein PilA
MKKFLQIMKKKKADNKGFSLVELIIVIAIMAILVGIVGTQVIPYLNKSKEAKDLQLINSYCTAAVSAYSSNVNKLSSDYEKSDFDLYGSDLNANDTILAADIKTLTGYDDFDTLSGKLASKAGKTGTGVHIVVDTQKKVVQAYLVNGSSRVTEFDIVTSEL